MRSTLPPAAVVLAVVVAVAVVPFPVAAHVNHVSVDAQASPDGTLVAETVFVASDGYLAVHRDDGGEIGAAVGHVPVSSAGGLQTDVTVPVDPSVWADWSTGTLWLVLHTSDGDGQFEPNGDDGVLATFGQPAGERIAVRNDDRALVTAETFAPQRLNATHTAVRIRNATLPRDGAVAVRAAESGQLLGRRNLSAGRHANVSVALDEAFLASHEEFAAEAVLVDGDGPVTAGDAPVATRFGVRYRGEGSTPTPALIQTATPTTEGSPDGTTGSDAPTATGPSDSPTGGSGPGFGLLAALAALAVATLLARRRI